MGNVLPLPAAPNYRSWSQLSTYSQCAERYRLKYLERLPTSLSGAMIGGRAVHDSIRILESKALNWEKAVWDKSVQEFAKEVFLESFWEALGDAGPVTWSGRKTFNFPGGEDSKWWAFQGPVMLKRYLGVRAEWEQNGWRPIEGGIERELLVDLPNGTQLKAIIDVALAADSDGQVVIVDWKTGTMRQGPAQIAAYAWVLEAAGIANASYGEYVWLRTTDHAKRREPYALDSLKVLIPEFFSRLDKAIENQDFPYSPGPLCKSCEVRLGCSYGKLLK